MVPTTTESFARPALAVALVAATLAIPVEAQPAELRIDGSSAARFEASVIELRNDLPARRREDFDVALAIIWARNNATSDFDGDGDMDLSDMRLLEVYADELLTNIRRGNVVAALEERPGRSDYTAADYYTELDGLNYDEVVELGGLDSAKSYLAAVQELGRGDACSSSRERSAVRLKSCAGSASSQRIGAATGAALNDAIVALNARNYGAARDAIARIFLDRVSSFERGKIEQILHAVSVGEGKYAEAREHLVSAIESGGLTPPEVANALSQIGAIDAALSAGAP